MSTFDYRHEQADRIRVLSLKATEDVRNNYCTKQAAVEVVACALDDVREIDRARRLTYWMPLLVGSVVMALAVGLGVGVSIGERQAYKKIAETPESPQ